MSASRESSSMAWSLPGTAPLTADVRQAYNPAYVGEVAAAASAPRATALDARKVIARRAAMLLTIIRS